MKPMIIRTGFLIFGLILIAAGAAIFSNAELGFDPFMVFDSGLANKLGLSLGITHITINLTLLLIYILVGQKRYINWGTLLAMTMTGLLIDAFNRLIQYTIPNEKQFVIQVIMVLAACPIMGLGVYLYTGARLGAGPNDLVAVILSDMSHKPFGIVRIMIDGMWIIVGVILGGSIGLGTLLSMCFVGSSIQLFKKFKIFAKHFEHFIST